MKKHRILALLGASIITLAGITPASAAPSEPAGNLVSNTPVSSESIAPLVTRAAGENGFKDRLVFWSVQDGAVRVGLTSVTGQERAALQRLLPLPVMVTKEEPIVTMDKRLFRMQSVAGVGARDFRGREVGSA
ncbi:hypothetical protein [Pseudarthrobacter sp. NBSH8]|uniref:hypothetical protein n=1 Tax=Pseudarthrobacter sp. NBSH8 TaxID=2596911 RepID=UPI001627DE1E|nr:hypothetical protein [Pseudarthrobacter sp. NBSH8]QNE15144.1 hypothetical protein FYJ92_12425 [Pseudarthrobacter sp. NBSH8]